MKGHSLTGCVWADIHGRALNLKEQVSQRKMEVQGKDEDGYQGRRAESLSEDAAVPSSTMLLLTQKTGIIRPYPFPTHPYYCPGSAALSSEAFPGHFWSFVSLLWDP